jgi:UDP-N-acetylglucosamine transferase subunit ALG13
VILVTVGSQAPFDRLIRAVDEWAHSRRRTDVFAQIASGEYVPKHVEFTRFVDPSEFRQLVEKSSVVVGHAGMGSIIAALELGKPIVVLPRRAHFRETRNDHQVAAAKYFGAQGRILVALEEEELPEKLECALKLGETERIATQASPQLIATIHSFLEGDSSAHNPAVSEKPMNTLSFRQGGGGR